MVTGNFETFNISTKPKRQFQKKFIEVKDTLSKNNHFRGNGYGRQNYPVGSKGISSVDKFGNETKNRTVSLKYNFDEPYLQRKYFCVPSYSIEKDFGRMKKDDRSLNFYPNLPPFEYCYDNYKDHCHPLHNLSPNYLSPIEQQNNKNKIKLGERQWQTCSSINRYEGDTGKISQTDKNMNIRNICYLPPVCNEISFLMPKLGLRSKSADPCSPNRSIFPDCKKDLVEYNKKTSNPELYCGPDYAMKKIIRNKDYSSNSRKTAGADCNPCKPYPSPCPPYGTCPPCGPCPSPFYSCGSCYPCCLPAPVCGKQTVTTYCYPYSNVFAVTTTYSTVCYPGTCFPCGSYFPCATPCFTCGSYSPCGPCGPYRPCGPC